MTSRSTWLALAVTVLVTGGSGWVHGRLSNRWGPPPAMLQAGAQLEKIPTQFGDWRMHSSGSLSDLERNMLECTGELVRTYVNQATHESVLVTMIVGPSIPTWQHTPEVCFPSRAFRELEPRKSVPLVDPNGTRHQFMAMTFRVTVLEGGVVRVWWGWTPGGPWAASLGSRFAVAAHPHLYKIQVVTRFAGPPEPGRPDPCERFLRDFLPVAARFLMASSEH